jgi:predicted  nucleic acid-binding Zn-ribbon protein
MSDTEKTERDYLNSEIQKLIDKLHEVRAENAALKAALKADREKLAREAAEAVITGELPFEGLDVDDQIKELSETILKKWGIEK